MVRVYYFYTHTTGEDEMNWNGNGGLAGCLKTPVHGSALYILNIIGDRSGNECDGQENHTGETVNTKRGKESTRQRLVIQTS